ADDILTSTMQQMDRNRNRDQGERPQEDRTEKTHPRIPSMFGHRRATAQEFRQDIPQRTIRFEQSVIAPQARTIRRELFQEFSEALEVFASNAGGIDIQMQLGGLETLEPRPALEGERDFLGSQDLQHEDFVAAQANLVQRTRQCARIS